MAIDLEAAAREAYELARRVVPIPAAELVADDRMVRAGAVWTVTHVARVGGRVAVRMWTSNPLFPNAPVAVVRRYDAAELVDSLREHA